MNRLHPSIEFEIEHPTNNTLSLLDVEVKVNDQDGTISMQHFKKKAKKDVFLNFNSALPASMKSSIIVNERKRIMSRCTSTENAKHHETVFEGLLLSNDYPMNWIRKAKNRKKRKERKMDNANDPFYVKLPFINEEINGRLKGVFRKEKFNIRFYYENSSLRGLLNSSFSTRTCVLVNCPINEVKLCLQQSVVYEVKCCTCSATYIGSTVRQLHTRVLEHLTINTSSVFKHLRACGESIHGRAGVKASVLAKDRDPINLRIKEAIMIKNRKPMINSKEEMNELASLIM
jgi:hypothetical protein